MTDTTALVAFLRARLDEDEAHARKDIWVVDQATPGKWETLWEALYGANLRRSQIQVGDMAIAVVASPQHEADVLLMARFRPDTVRERAERVLREVEAKRQIIYDYEEHDELDQIPALDHAIQARTLLKALHWLARPYADHDDYDPAWRI
jgi:hypothetical protein